MKLLESKDLVLTIKQKQAEVVAALHKQKIDPTLAIVVTVENPVIDVYMRMKQKYGADLGVEVTIYRIAQADTIETLEKLNADPTVSGIIVQLPLEDPSQTEEIVNHVAPEKDVDALGSTAVFEPATPMAILWLIAGYKIDMHDKKVVLVGRGKLVGAPLDRMLTAEDIDVSVATRSSTPDIATETLKADVIITATGSAGGLRSNMVKLGAVVVDAGVAGEGGKTVGDVADEVYERDDIWITPTKGGVGPLTVCALFENVLHAAGGDMHGGSLPTYYSRNASD